jgi:predicted transcriptional regulator
VLGGVPRARGALEREVLACLAVADQPMTAHQVLDELDPSLAYTTVLTTLTRLHAKGALERTEAGRAYAYALPTGVGSAGDSVAARSMLRLLDTGDNRAAVLARFVADLSPDDEAVLSELLTDHPTSRGLR